MKSVELEDDYIRLIVKVLNEKRQDLAVILKNPDGLEQETIQKLELEHRDLGNIMRELQFYSVMK